MDNTYERIKKLCNLIVTLNVTDIVCNVALATILQDGIDFKLQPLNMSTYKIEKKR
jgi:hypothetical protein